MVCVWETSMVTECRGLRSNDDPLDVPQDEFSKMKFKERPTEAWRLGHSFDQQRPAPPSFPRTIKGQEEVRSHCWKMVVRYGSGAGAGFKLRLL